MDYIFTTVIAHCCPAS